MIQSKVAQRLAELGDLGMLAFSSVGILVFVFLTDFLADVLIEQRPFAVLTFRALFDGMVHGVLGLLVTSPLIGTGGDVRRTGVLFSLIILTATLIDLDHFVVAGSVDVPEAVSLGKRPPTHSLTFAGVLGVVAFLVSRSPIVGWGMFAALSSHVIRDASRGGTQILWPLSLEVIPRWVYYFGAVGLFLASYLLAKTEWTT